MPKTLDFLCIGAAKSATTTLHELLKDHPDISLPASKEAPFFNDNHTYHKGLNWYIKTHFGAHPNKLLGTVTPHYMFDQIDVTVEETAKRIHDTIPDEKIIALLRNPVDRAYSHYKMLRQRGYEHRSFEQAVTDLQAGKNTIKNYSEPDSDYLALSRYGEILAHYYKLFPKKNILIITTNELSNDPVGTISKVLKFIGASPNAYSPPADTVARKGGTKPRVKQLSPGFLYSLPLVKKTWQTTMPYSLRRSIEYRINLWNTAGDDDRLDKESTFYKDLIEYFKKDAAQIKKLSGHTMPWSKER